MEREHQSRSTDKESPMITQGLQPHVSTREEPPLYFLGLPTLLRATAETTGGAFGLVEQVLPPGFASPYHTHHLEDEAFYVVEGEMAFVCDGRWTRARPGTYVFGPRNIAHGFKVLGPAPARLLLLCTPGGFEQFVLDMSEPTPAPPDMAKLMAVAAKYTIDVHGPLPEEPAAV
jgi:quercetin dioxygenase-like cupin family protein